MKRVVLVTSHYLNSDRKAGFHWLADALWRQGWHVLFFTESISWLSWLRRDARFKYPILKEAGQLRDVDHRLKSYVWLTPYHPINLRKRLLNRWSNGIHSRYGTFAFREAEPEIAQADLFIFDSDHGLFLFDRFKAMNARAKFVYRVSDDIPMMRHHPIVLETETRVAPRFDLISVPCDYIARRFAFLPQVILQKHGLRKAMFDVPTANPYEGSGPHLVYVGNDYVDVDFLGRAARLMPEANIHVFGAVKNLPAALNLKAHGEQPFSAIVPYLKHAAVGLQARSYCPGAECLTDSLKMHQYTYCRLPIVAPTFLRNERQHVYYYTPGDDASILQAIQGALHHDRSKVSIADVKTWDEIVDAMLDAIGLTTPLLAKAS